MLQKLFHSPAAPQHHREEPAHQEEELHPEPMNHREYNIPTRLPNEHPAMQDNAQKHGKATHGIQIMIAFLIQGWVRPRYHT